MADDIIALAEAWLEVLPQGDFDAFPGRVADNFVLRLPFVPDGVPTAFHGRDNAREALRRSARGRSPLIFTDKIIRRTDDPELVVTTARAEATMANGRIYRNEYVMFTRIAAATVLEHIEYLNPLAIMAAMQGD